VTVDWFVLLTPLVLLVVALPLLFVGCTEFTSSGPGIGTVAGPGLGIAPLTHFRLEMDLNLQAQVSSPVVRIEVTWSLEGLGALPIVVPQPPPSVIVARLAAPTDPVSSLPTIDPDKDLGASARITTDSIENRDRVRCNCKVFLRNGNTPTVRGTTDQARLGKNLTHTFRIKSPTRNEFEVYFSGT
jgi:hypothetical protein